MPFRTNLVLESVRGHSRRFLVAESLEYVTLRGLVITVPVDFETDLASVPRPFWAFFPPSAKYRDAAVVHDYLYKTACLGEIRLSRAEADRIFREACHELGVKRRRIWLMWLAVRIGGRGCWND